MSNMIDPLAGAGGPPASITIGGGPGGPGAGAAGTPDNPESAQALKAAIAAVSAYLSAENDEQDKAVAARVLAQLHGLQGGRAREADAAMGISPALKMLRRGG